MGVFLQIVGSFPTVVFTLLLGVSLLYWLVATLGLLELDALDNLFIGDMDSAEVGGLAALLNKVGLGRVPLTIIFTLIFLFGWVICFAGVRLFMPATDAFALRFVMGAVIFAASLVLALLATIVALRPVHAMLRKIPTDDEPKIVIGRTGVVRSASVSPTQGYATVDDGGAGLILQVRTASGELPHGTQVVVVQRLDRGNVWLVVSKKEFEEG